MVINIAIVFYDDAKFEQMICLETLEVGVISMIVHK